MSHDAPDAAGLFRRHHLEVFRFLRKMTGETECAEDLCQDVFVRVARGLADYSEAGHERAWIYRIARNVLANHRRDRGRRLRPVGLDEASVRDAAATVAELRVSLDDALGCLAETDREVFLLRELGGLDYEEIAAACEITSGAVRNRLHRARRDLRERLTMPARAEPASESGR